jgi:hypothetical protein
MVEYVTTMLKSVIGYGGATAAGTNQEEEKKGQGGLPRDVIRENLQRAQERKEELRAKTLVFNPIPEVPIQAYTFGSYTLIDTE